MDDPGVSSPGRASLIRTAARLEKTLGSLSRTLQVRDRERATGYDLSVSQFHALLALGRGGPMTVTGLAVYLHLEKSTASRLAKGLQARELVRKRSPSSDDRVVILQATEQGLRLSRKILNDLAEEHTDLLAGFDPTLRDLLPGVLERLQTGLELRTPLESSSPRPQGT